MMAAFMAVVFAFAPVLTAGEREKAIRAVGKMGEVEGELGHLLLDAETRGQRGKAFPRGDSKARAFRRAVGGHDFGPFLGHLQAELANGP